MAGGVRVTLDGLTSCVAALNGFRVRASDLSNAFQRISGSIKRDASSLTPVLSGRLLGSIRAANARSKATVRAGSARIPYAGVQNYGNYHNIEAKHFLNRALLNNETRSVAEIERELSNLIRQFQLNN